jgi:peroxiredoxin
MATEATSPETPARPPSRLRRWALDLALVSGLYLAITGWQERHLLDDRIEAPGFSLRTLSGESVALPDFRGKRVLLHFWATWCGVCRREFGALNAVHAALDADEVLLSVVADSDDPEAVRRVVADEGIAYPVLLGTNDVVAAYRVKAFPTNYFIDANGRISDQTVGMSSRLGLSRRLGCAR